MCVSKPRGTSPVQERATADEARPSGSRPEEKEIATLESTASGRTLDATDVDINLYLVGGAVRDRLLGRTPRERDFAFDSTENTFLQRNPHARKVGKSVSVILLNGEEYMPLRGTLEQDLLLRDLTINAVAEDAKGRLYSHPQALSDVRDKILRPASPHSFSDDPVRVFRLARMACELPDFSIHEESVRQMQVVAAAGLLHDIPAERVSRELVKALATPAPSRWLGVLAAGGCLSPWFAELEGADRVPAGPLPYHADSVLRHTMTIMDRTAGDPLSVWMALCHDLGKLETPQEEWPHHYGHEKRGMDAAERLGKRLLSTRTANAGRFASCLHMKAGLYGELKIGTRCDLLLQVHTAQLDASFWRLVEADSGKHILPEVMADLHALLAVKLPLEWRGRGAASGERLRLLRCEALARQRSMRRSGTKPGEV